MGGVQTKVCQRILNWQKKINRWPFACRKDQRKKTSLNTNRTFRPQWLSQQNREQSGEERSYISVPSQRDIGAPVPGTVKQVKGKVEEMKGLSDCRGYRGISAPVPGTVKLVRGEGK